MSSTDSLFAAFDPVSQEDWQARALKELRGKALKDLDWQLGEAGTVQPYYTVEEVESPEPLPLPFHPNGWGIAEQIDCTDVKRGNKQLLKALQGGVNVPMLLIPYKIKEPEMRALFQGAKGGYVDTQFRIPSQKLKRASRMLSTFHRIAVGEQGEQADNLHGGINLDYIDEGVDFAQLADAFQMVSELLPKFTLVSVNGCSFHRGPEGVVDELAHTLAKISEYMTYLKLHRLNPKLLARHICVEMQVGTSYLLEISKLRAFRLLWGNLLKGFGAPVDVPLKLLVHTSLQDYSDEPNQNMIRSTIMAMSAALGGASAIHIYPSDFKTGQTTPFSQRIARNIHHILTMESHLHRVVDPMAGSYYIETMTDLLAAKAWEVFQGIEKRGGYLEI